MVIIACFTNRNRTARQSNRLYIKSSHRTCIFPELSVLTGRLYGSHRPSSPFSGFFSRGQHRNHCNIGIG